MAASRRFLFGARRGAVVCVVGKNIGNVVCVLLAKSIMSGYVRKNLLPRLQNTRVIERMAKRQGFIAILIFRGLVYAPLPLKNYGLGVRQLRHHFGPYLTLSQLCITLHTPCDMFHLVPRLSGS